MEDGWVVTTPAVSSSTTEQAIYILRTPRNSELEPLTADLLLSSASDLAEADRSSGGQASDLRRGIFTNIQLSAADGDLPAASEGSPAAGSSSDSQAARLGGDRTGSVAISATEPAVTVVMPAVSDPPEAAAVPPAIEDMPVISGKEEEEEVDGEKEAAEEDVGISITEVPASSWERRPRIIAGGGAKNQILLTAHKFQDYEEPTTVDWFDGQYYEQNPGQYHETNPGQYHEENPGQYHEENPGQYHEENPGQYRYHHQQQQDDDDDQPQQQQQAGGQDQLVDVDDLTVDFNHKDETKIYNVQAKAGEFIIGEVGKINLNNGQTLEGVRYTAVDGFLDKGKISEILLRFFGTQTLAG